MLGSIIVAVVIAIADQVTKAVIVSYLVWGEARTLIPGLFNIVYYKNTGAAFGIFASGGSARTIFLTVVSGVALVVIAVLIRKSDRRSAFALSLIAGGAVGNLIDRLRYGSVVDFLDLHAGTLHWPAFNIADSAITVGVVIMLYLSFFASDRESGHPPRRQILK
ncbi:MAG: signal peptidase II [Proteobacteria bacterium]|nr:signal peptidase II [Pseudomonadota bacterium]